MGWLWINEFSRIFSLSMCVVCHCLVGLIYYISIEKVNAEKCERYGLPSGNSRTFCNKKQPLNSSSIVFLIRSFRYCPMVGWIHDSTMCIVYLRLVCVCARRNIMTISGRARALTSTNILRDSNTFQIRWNNSILYSGGDNIYMHQCNSMETHSIN